MKKIFLFVVLCLVAFGIYYYYVRHYYEEVPKLVVEEKQIDIDNIIVYGTHLNLHGTETTSDNFDLVLYNGDFIKYDVNITSDGFNLSDYINKGLDLEEIPVGDYFLLGRSCTTEEEEEICKYYALNNVTKYKETTYYTFSNVGNKIIINSNNEYNTLSFNVKANTDNDIYDVVIDAGHGGLDSGASKYGYNESDFTLKLAYSLKEKLEVAGIKVKLTRVENQLADDEMLNDYGENGRAVINHEVKAKYVFSIHLNSNYYSDVHGLEIYTPANIDYGFAKRLAKNISLSVPISYSTNKINKKYDGIYTRTFTADDIASAKEEYAEKNKLLYDVTVGTNYYFMIRETGGIMTGAYVDERNEPKYLRNPYHDSNIGSEAYLLELGYLSNYNDLVNIRDNMEKYTTAIAETFIDVFQASKKDA